MKAECAYFESTQNVVVMASICSMQNKRRKFSDKVVWCPQNLITGMSTMCDRDKSKQPKIVCMQKTMENAYFPSGENLISRTDFWKLKWCRTTPRRALTRRARLSSSTEIKTFPSGLSAMTSVVFLISKGNVKDLLLCGRSRLQFSTTDFQRGLLDFQMLCTSCRHPGQRGVLKSFLVAPLSLQRAVHCLSFAPMQRNFHCRCHYKFGKSKLGK